MPSGGVISSASLTMTSSASFSLFTSVLLSSGMDGKRKWQPCPWLGQGVRGPTNGWQVRQNQRGEVMVQVACKQVHLGCAPQLEQLEHNSLTERRHSVRSGRLQGRKSASLLLAPDPCIALTMLDLGINHWTSVYVSSLRVLETTPLCLFIYNTVVALSDSIKMFGRGLPAPDAGGSGRLP